MKHEYLSDMVNYYRTLMPIDEIDAIVDRVEAEHPNLYQRNNREYLTMIEIEINNYIGHAEQKRRPYQAPEVKEVVPPKKYNQSVEG